MEAVDGDELLGDRVGRRVVLLVGADDAADHLGADVAELLAHPGGQDAVPVGVHRALEDGVGEDARGPLDRVDLALTAPSSRGGR